LTSNTPMPRATKVGTLTSFKSFAEKLIAQQRTMVGSKRNDLFLVDDLKLLERQQAGLNAFFGTK